MSQTYHLKHEFMDQPVYRVPKVSTQTHRKITQEVCVDVSFHIQQVKIFKKSHNIAAGGREWRVETATQHDGEVQQRRQSGDT